MLTGTIDLLIGELNRYLHGIEPGLPRGEDPAVSGNIALLGQDGLTPPLSDHIVLTLINVAEEHTLKNARRSLPNRGKGVQLSNPPLHLNLFLLFTANYRDYPTAMTRIGQVLSFFQAKSYFTQVNSPGSGERLPQAEDFSLTMDLLSLSFEEINHLWGSLGGRQIPFALYQGRLLALQNPQITQSGGEITDISVSVQDSTI